ncbi:MAG: hypothetical protein FWE42_07255 [Defluviitaleaceae bacterium]|nr:hypothetical protein [Defluviitaleaceae bacterium]
MGLFKPAWQSKNLKKAINAIEQLSDQDLLSEIARDCVYTDKKNVMHQDRIPMAYPVRLAAFKKLTDHEKLMSVATYTSYDGDIEEMAIKKLTKQDDLRLVALYSNRLRNRLLAIEKLTDQKALADIAQMSTNSAVYVERFRRFGEDFNKCRIAAIMKLSDKTILTHIEKSENDAIIRKAAQERLRTCIQ